MRNGRLEKTTFMLTSVLLKLMFHVLFFHLLSNIFDQFEVIDTFARNFDRFGQISGFVSAIESFSNRILLDPLCSLILRIVIQIHHFRTLFEFHLQGANLLNASSEFVFLGQSCLQSLTHKIYAVIFVGCLRQDRVFNLRD